ncbi:MAG: hypothetical protein ACD_78C00121G0002 [uncultured bacterium (gcode 4)]|uniref:Uncharacterized protein n=1 Tax=uncultured bacterium (gcode 4) TaxID=1234023 RepID=K1XIQ3_9BACT|nr:MAG: hypothetical protein ACD_78C00121G0002 [uncultured bacterium (gcode 4)]
MSELVNVFSLDTPDVILPTERKSFYQEQTEIFKKTGKPTKAVNVVNIFLFNEAWQLILQKRANNKAHNPDLIDKSVGWHIVYGDSPNFTVMLETVQELQVPSIVLNNDEDFNKTYALLKSYVATTAVVKHFATELVSLTKIINDEHIAIGNKTYLYVWIYEGSLRNVDREAKWVLFYSLPELEYELGKFPDIFTYDLQFYFAKYKEYFLNFIKEVQEIKGS